MRPSTPRRLLSAALTAVLLAMPAAAPAAAGELSAFNAMVAEAYANYRAASFYFRTGNPAVAADELAGMAEAWRKVEKRFAGAPPDAFADDPRWGATLAAVAERIERAAAAADRGDPDAGAEALRPIRGLLADLRRRNGVIVFSDHVNALNAQMDVLWAYRHDPPDMASPQAVDAAIAAAAVYAYLLERCRRRAPAAYAEDAGFRRVMEGAATSVARLPAALRAKDERAFVNTLRELVSFDRMIFLRYG